VADTADDNLKQIVGPTPDCLDANDLAALAETDALRQSAAGRHVESCSHCQGELALMRSFLDEHLTDVESPHVDAIVRELRRKSPVRARPWWRRAMGPWALAPALAAAALVTIVVMNVGEHRMGEVNINLDSGVVRSESIEVLQPVGDVTSLPQMIAWKGVAGAAKYRVRVLEVDRTVVWDTIATSTEVSMPPPSKVAIEPGRTMSIEIDALDASGNVIAKSGAVSFRLQTSH
jgi:hypothetical protein